MSTLLLHDVWRVMQEIRLNISDSQDIGVVISGGAGSQCGNPCDVTDEGIFISEVSSSCLTCVCFFLTFTWPSNTSSWPWPALSITALTLYSATLTHLFLYQLTTLMYESLTPADFFRHHLVTFKLWSLTVTIVFANYIWCRWSFFLYFWNLTNITVTNLFSLLNSSWKYAWW